MATNIIALFDTIHLHKCIVEQRNGMYIQQMPTSAITSTSK